MFTPSVTPPSARAGSPTQSGSSNPAETASPPQTSSRKGIGSDYQTFLKMLTTQMKNQDPMKPIDSADYAAQLATFSGVEQQVKTNTLLEALGSQFGILGMSQLAGWVGQEARSVAPVWKGADPVTLGFKPDIKADRAVLVVKDAKGGLVAREDVPKGATSLDWTGMATTGGRLPDGVYSLSLESYQGERKIATSDVEAYGQITEARSGPEGVMLVMKGGVEIAATKVSALRLAS